MEELELNAREESLRKQLEDPIYRHAKWEGRQSDWLLQWAVGLVENTNLGVPFTLTVGGSLISGALVSSTIYFEALSEEMSRPFASVGPEAAEAMKGIIHTFRDTETHEQGDPPHQFIHLKDARVFTGPNGSICSTGVLWRGKISAVDGFNIGVLTTP